MAVMSRNADYQSSIKILIVDQLDALMMQNWEHVKVRSALHALDYIYVTSR